MECSVLPFYQSWGGSPFKPSFCLMLIKCLKQGLGITSILFCQRSHLVYAPGPSTATLQLYYHLSKVFASPVPWLRVWTVPNLLCYLHHCSYETLVTTKMLLHAILFSRTLPTVKGNQCGNWLFSSNMSWVTSTVILYLKRMSFAKSPANWLVQSHYTPGW